MATSREYIDWVCERLAPYGEVRRRAMFGEYIVSLNGKNVVSVCDNCVFVKELPALAETFRDAERGFPYDGAKEHYILDMEDRALLDEVVPLLDEHMPLSKPRKSKRSIITRPRQKNGLLQNSFLQQPYFYALSIPIQGQDGQLQPKFLF